MTVFAKADHQMIMDYFLREPDAQGTGDFNDFIGDGFGERDSFRIVGHKLNPAPGHAAGRIHGAVEGHFLPDFFIGVRI